jgi:hypothetical protein
MPAMVDLPDPRNSWVSTKKISPSLTISLDFNILNRYILHKLTYLKIIELPPNLKKRYYGSLQNMKII